MKWIGRRKFNKIAKIAGIVALILATTMGVFTFFGVNGSNFVINSQASDSYNLSLYDDEELRLPRTRISFPGMNNQDNITLDNIPDNIEDGIGDKNEYIRRGYVAFSFYLVNHSTVDVDMRMAIEIHKVTKNVDSAMRLMLIVDGDREIYAKPQEVGESSGLPEDNPYLTLPFHAPLKVCEKDYQKFKSRQVMKFTIVLWLEGFDEQCVDSIKGGSIRLSMSIWVV